MPVIAQVMRNHVSAANFKRPKSASAEDKTKSGQKFLARSHPVTLLIINAVQGGWKYSDMKY